MTEPNQKVCGLILAAGTSSRMGQPKAFIKSGESYFLHQIYERLQSVTTSATVIVTNKGILACLSGPRMSAFQNATFIVNNDLKAGQMHSLKLGLKAARESEASGAIVSLVDFPWVKSETFAAISSAARQNSNKIIIPRYNGKHGHPYFLPANHYDDFLNSQKTARDVLHSLQQAITWLDVEDSHILRDADVPEDLLK